MGLGLSLLYFVVILGLGWIAGYLPFMKTIFGTILPYVALLLFLVGIIARIVRWGRSPVPFRITTTCGQEKSLPWIRQNKLDNPSSALGAFGRMLLEVLFFRSLFRNTKAEFKENEKLVYSVDKWLWFFSLAFHWSFLIIFLRHFRFFTEPIPSFVTFLQNIDGFFQVGLPIIYITDVLILAGLTYLFLRRIFDTKVKIISLPSDYFPLLLILGIAVTGVLMRYFFKTDLVAVKEFTVSILSFQPIGSDLLAKLSPLFIIHFTFVCTLLIYFPFSKLVHLGGIFLSPTRNLANNNRMKRHVNPWNYDVPVHTYEEYEEEFRDKMIAAGIPVEKEE
ncbi:menaquinol oxidoreductase [Bacteroidetes/Chlorobi group bacterium Naka2016]|jgi:nitrate reductase gamma subunit|nr:MAG: menaquinol oxidoreductase [Bacteroidetes/Chlorobi group bacterium Naka2016]